MSEKENIVSALDAYLLRGSSPYAVMLDGAWGTGKTHFILNSYIPAHPQYKFVYVSLFGLKSVDELNDKIESALAHSSMHLTSKLTAVGGSDLEFKSAANKFPQKVIVTSSEVQVICFDDLERWHGDIELCLSRVNELVEHAHWKCILIGNLDAIPHKSVRSFYQACEKTIRHVYRYANTSENTLDVALGLVSYENNSSRIFLEDLIKNNIDPLTKFLDKVDLRNIRVITEALQLYEFVFRYNAESMRSARQLSFTYLISLIALLLLVKRYLIDRSSRNKLLKGEHETNKGFKFLSDIGYFEDDAPSCITEESRVLLDTIFYRLDKISLKGICSIVKNGYYIDEDFEGNFEDWCEEKHYELYLDRDRYFELDDDLAKQVFDSTLKTLVDDRLITNPVTYLLLAERIVDDISKGLVDFNPVQFKKRAISAAESLYDSRKMKLMDVSIFDVTGDRFTNCRGIYNYLIKRNDDYRNTIEKEKLIDFWTEVIEPRDLPVHLLDQFSPGEVFAHTRNIEDMFHSLEAMSNSHLHQLANWIEDGWESVVKFIKTSDGELFQAAANTIIRLHYGMKTGIRANHFRRISEVLKHASEARAASW